MAQNNPSAAICPLYRRCGGCQMQNLTYPQQLEWKQRQVQRLLGEFAPVRPILGMEQPLHYRNKVQAAFGTDRGGKIISGVYQSSSHRIVPVDHCLIEDETADAIIVSIRKLMPGFKMTAYDADTGRGFLRHVLVRRGFSSGEVMVVLVTGSPIFPAKRAFCEALRKLHPEITTIVHNINPYRTSLVLGEREQALYGPGYIEDTLCGLTFRLSPRSFYQINPVQTERLYARAIAMAGLTGRETVVDAYCGIGTIGLIASRMAGEVIGVELNRDAVRDAISNARRNRVQNIRFHCADAGEYLVEAAQAGHRADVVLMDPPRAGSDEAFLSSVAVMNPRRVVYISCNPETQARDLRFLTARGYRAEAIQPVDMFPYTNHVETVVLMSRASK